MSSVDHIGIAHVQLGFASELAAPSAVPLRANVHLCMRQTRASCQVRCYL